MKQLSHIKEFYLTVIAFYKIYSISDVSIQFQYAYKKYNLERNILRKVSDQNFYIKRSCHVKTHCLIKTFPLIKH